MEADLREVATASLDLDADVLQARCEQSIRNHDPCISCAAHFLKFEVHRHDRQRAAPGARRRRR
jgi:coenzyme F420-reducing hydrogenase alpha subunit